MKMYKIISLTILSVGLSQELPRVVESYENGNIKSITFHKETPTGIEKTKYESYYNTGRKSSEGTYLNGKEDGLWTYWYENGQKRWEGTVKNGQRKGIWTYWHENGKKGSEVTYMDREEGGLQFNFHLDKECWDEDGNLCECGQFWWDGCK